MSDLLGSHVSMSGKKMLIGAAEEAASYGATAMMVYTGAPQNTRRKPIAELQSEAGQQKMAECGIRQLVVHAPYIINLANTIKRMDNAHLHRQENQFLSPPFSP